MVHLSTAGTIKKRVIFLLCEKETNPGFIHIGKSQHPCEGEISERERRRRARRAAAAVRAGVAHCFAC